jgi:aromatic ring-opening dioxygenase LigB subunit
MGAMARLASRLLALRPGGITLISPHSPRQARAFGLWSGSSLRGSFGEFGAPEVSVALPNDLALTAELKTQAGKAGLPTWEIPSAPLDHGALVPLWYLVAAGWNGPTAVLSLNHPGEGGLADLGQLLGRAAQHLGLRIGVLASGDMSHRLTHAAPGGYEPRAGEFDLTFLDLLAQGAYRDLERLEPRLVELAGQDALESTIVAAAAADWNSAGHEVLSYEPPFGVGYGVAVLFDSGTFS